MSLLSPIECGTEYSFLNILKKVVKKDEDGNYYISTTGLASDKVAPFPINAEVGLIADGVIFITFSEPLDETSVPDGGDFVVNGMTNPGIINVVSINASWMRLMITTNVLFGDVITFDYTPGANPIRDLAGNLCAPLVAFPVTNNVVDIVAPQPLTAEVGIVADNVVVIVFDEPLNNGVTPAAGSFVVNGMTDPAATTGILVIGSSVRLTLATDVYYGDVVTITYTQPGLNPLQDPAGNLVASFVAFAMTNNVPVCSQYATVLAAMTTDPGANDTIYQNTLLKRFVARGYFAKSELIDIFSVHINTGGEACLNWKSPGTFNPSMVNAPVFVAYQGFTGNDPANRSIRLNFNPVANGTLIGQNNICCIIGVGTNVAETVGDFGAYDAAGDELDIQSRRATNTLRTCCNSSDSNLAGYLNSIAHYAISRGVAANYDRYINLAKTNLVKASTGTVNAELYTCGFNTNGVISQSSKQIRYVLVLSYLIEAEVQDVIGIMESYLDSVGTGLY